jgi:hypothetical protein
MKICLLAALHGNCLQSFNVPDVAMSWLGVSDYMKSKIAA